MKAYQIFYRIMSLQHTRRAKIIKRIRDIGIGLLLLPIQKNVKRKRDKRLVAFKRLALEKALEKARS